MPAILQSNTDTDNSFSYIPWHSHQIHLFPSNPYPQPAPPIAHKVWILDCKACGSFLTNRGMKAVLLLRPNVSLYSSDALPVNCSAFSANPDALRPSSSRKSSVSSVPPRTCECLTQTLCCHGCGSTIGYMIVIPCARCTSSITATNRATNGHRFVFHSSEVAGTERHYIKDEPGVVPFDPLTLSQPTYPSVFSSPIPRNSFLDHQETTPSQLSSPNLRQDYLPTPPLEFARPSFPSPRNQSSEPESHHRSPSPTFSSSSHMDVLTHPSPPADNLHNRRSPPLSTTASWAAEHKDSVAMKPTLNPGDVVFWHHLARSGEIPGVTDDERARHPSPSEMSNSTSRGAYFNR